MATVRTGGPRKRKDGQLDMRFKSSREFAPWLALLRADDYANTRRDLAPYSDCGRRAMVSMQELL